VERRKVTVTVNGRRSEVLVEPRRLLCDVIREDLGLTGTHVGCEHGVCGACTVLVDGRAERSCMTFAVQVDGASIETVESLAGDDGQLSALQQAFWDCHGLQCGFCTPGILMTLQEFLTRQPHPSEAEIRLVLAGNICRCTGYDAIVRSVQQAVLSSEARDGGGAEAAPGEGVTPS
jgi:aerobic-type carbon monoxide dehydrogenase small subunit (CoxS/CutS family)